MLISRPELGHAFQQLFTETRFTSPLDIDLPSDFLEVPGGVLESLYRNEDVLQRIGRHPAYSNPKA